MKSWFKALSLGKRAALLAVIGVGTVTIGAAAASNPQSSQPQPSVQTQTQQTAKPTPVVTKKTETQTKAVPYQSSPVDDANLAVGTTQTRTAGVDGVETITYEVTLTDGQETSRTQTSDTVTTPPVNEVISKGTKQPADGRYSFSQTRSGTCSHHGGVARWL